MSKYKWLTLFILLAFITTSGFGCKWNPFSNNDPALKPVTIEYWGVWDKPNELASLINSYQTQHPTIKVNYRNFRYEEYEDKLLQAWADDRGPDLFSIPVTWLKKYQPRLESMPATIKIPVLESVGSIRPELVTVLKDFQGLSPRDLKLKFVPIVYDNVVLDNKVYGLPYSVDTLVTFYNSDILSKEGIAEPIKDFNDLVEQTPKISKATEANNIIQSAVDLGGVDNINNFFDVFSSIMLQNGVEAKGASFNPDKNEGAGQKLADVFGFYADFARPGRATYSWNEKLDNALEMFASGKLAYYFGYSYDAQEFRNRGLQFNWEITNFPQTRGAQGTKYYGDYWINVVPKKADNKDAAWDFIQRTAEADLVAGYLKENKRPTALRSLINEQLKNDDLRIFASQVLTADNWYSGYDINAAKKYLGDTIKALLVGDISLDTGPEALKIFIQRINQTYAKPEN
ncbi:MAG: hypothetical protein C3F02_01895 [Parcubacteria group bacterium]|nr:MAG: hypothetical protein C3F02_01895 [Parcubacteria group bacterium]